MADIAVKARLFKFNSFYADRCCHLEKMCDGKQNENNQG